ncbi:MAG: YfiR family protein [Rhodoferax sp.]|nr:YfiR family protein [Rhodoferax sp.]
MSARTVWQTGFALLLSALATLAQAQHQAPEPELKAAILVNMLLFVDWPDQHTQPTAQVTMCYLGIGPVATALLQLDGKLLKGKPLRVVQVQASKIAHCHALYVAPFEADNLSNVVALARTHGVLLMGDSAGYWQRGVMLNLDLDHGRVVFDVDLNAVRQAALSISSKVLRLARQVIE